MPEEPVKSRLKKPLCLPKSPVPKPSPPEHSCGATLPHPKPHVQHQALHRAPPCCEPLRRAAAARGGRVKRCAQELVANAERWRARGRGGAARKGLLFFLSV